MDLQTVLAKIELDFFNRLEKNAYWSKEEVKKELNDAIENVLVLSYARIMKDAKEIKDGP